MFINPVVSLLAYVSRGVGDVILTRASEKATVVNGRVPDTLCPLSLVLTVPRPSTNWNITILMPNDKGE